MTIDLWAMTVAPASRIDEAIAAFDTAGIPEERRVCVTTQPDPIATRDFPGTVLLFDSEEINISKWWNLAENHIYEENKVVECYNGTGEFVYSNPLPYDVLLIESDARMTPQDIETVRRVMREEDCVMAGADWKGLLTDGQHKVRRDNSRWRVEGRLPGTCHIFAGELGIRHDPEFRWFLSDDNWVYQHQSSGGTVLVAGTTVDHGDSKPLDAVRYQYWTEDIIKFREKWGDDPFHGSLPL